MAALALAVQNASSSRAAAALQQLHQQSDSLWSSGSEKNDADGGSVIATAVVSDIVVQSAPGEPVLVQP